MKRSNAILLALAAGGAAAFAHYAMNEKMLLRTYTIVSEKIKAPVKIIQISDLHSSKYGKNCVELIKAVKDVSPDVIVMTGDILDNRAPNGECFRFLRKIASLYPCYYVSGNHEVYTHLADEIKAELISYGIRVLDGETDSLKIGEQNIVIGGVSDPIDLPDKHGRLWEDQLADCGRTLDGSKFSVLLTHRPELISYYEETPFDLVLCGHAHGGQAIIPKLVNGIYAPHQGFFPKYAGGEYVMANGGKMIVSRGLSKYVRPRIFNRPELVLVTLMPSGEDR
ncbi:MAG: metallophosphoesterase [Clostridia bacterium]|nr:metallophosphoesterase [Clostridia bacterium]